MVSSVEKGSGINHRSLEILNENLQKRGNRVTIQQLKEGLWARGTFPQADGTKKRQRISLGLKASSLKDGTAKAEERAVKLLAAINELGHVPEILPWQAAKISEVKKVARKIKVAEAIEKLKEEFWKGRARTSAAERTWQRMQPDFDRLPQKAYLSTDLLIAHIHQTEAGTSSRIKICQFYKRLGKLHDLRGLSRIDDLAGTYEPARREIPDEEHLIELVSDLRSDPKWGWMTAALLVYGMRPSEAFSLQIKPNGLGRCLTVKRKNKLPHWRTCLALPQHLVEALNLEEVNKPFEINSPQEYDSIVARNQTNYWGRWLKNKVGHMDLQLYDLRHAWAIRSIRSNLETALASKCLGHDITTHVKVYSRYLDEKDIAVAAAKLL